MDEYSDFNALHSGKHDGEVELIAFDIVALDGDDLRQLPLSMRKANLQRLLLLSALALTPRLRTMPGLAIVAATTSGSLVSSAMP